MNNYIDLCYENGDYYDTPKAASNGMLLDI